MCPLIDVARSCSAELMTGRWDPKYHQNRANDNETPFQWCFTGGVVHVMTQD